MIIGKNPHSLINKMFDYLSCYLYIINLLFIKPTQAIYYQNLSLDDTTPANLTSLMNDYGSDKGRYHGYTEVYENILEEKRKFVSVVVEIGIGTNNPELLSSMGRDGKPGASLRAWREYFPNSTVYGFDIDIEILFTEKRIETGYVDQLKRNSFASVRKLVGSPIDLIIIDGLHTPRADFNSLVELLPCLRVGGDLFIEDVGNRAVKYFWPSLTWFLRKSFKITAYNVKEGNLIHVKPKRIKNL